MWILLYWIVVILIAVVLMGGISLILKLDINARMRMVEKYIQNISQKVGIKDNRITVGIIAVVGILILGMLSSQINAQIREDQIENVMERSQQNMEELQENMQQRMQNY